MTSRTNVIYIRYDAVTATYECLYQHGVVFIENHIIKIVYSCFTVHRQKLGTVRTLEWHLHKFTMASRTNVIYIRYAAVTATYECMYQHGVVFIGNHIIKIVYSCFTVHRQKWGSVRTLSGIYTSSQ